jgi:hypothetical protein
VRGFTAAIRSELLHQNSKVQVAMVELPGVNTPQFEWCRTKIPRHPQPVGPVYEPEIPARAIVWAARHPRREIDVGMPTVATILLNKLAPGWLDRLMARHAYGQQFMDEPISPDRPDNLFHPVATPYRARGRFEQRAHRTSPQLWASMHRGLVGSALAVTALATLAWARRRS